VFYNIKRKEKDKKKEKKKEKVLEGETSSLE